jgi:HAD superfamily hydrolase (TIGR01459 family)
VRRDRLFFEALPGISDQIATADALACTGLVDDRRERPEDYLPVLRAARERSLPFVCANPDLSVHVGADLLPCAGAIATLYEALGGSVHWAGKPHPIAYETALEVATELRAGQIARSRVLAIGDSIRTDLAAAAAAGVDALFIASGIHRDEVMADGSISGQSLAAALAGLARRPIASAASLRW